MISRVLPRGFFHAFIHYSVLHLKKFTSESKSSTSNIQVEYKYLTIDVKNKFLKDLKFDALTHFISRNKVKKCYHQNYVKKVICQKKSDTSQIYLYS